MSVQDERNYSHEITMNYDPEKHLLRPLKEGEIIEAGDVYAASHALVPTGILSTETPYNPKEHFLHFRPVAIPRWQSRCEANGLNIGSDPLIAIHWRDGTRSVSRTLGSYIPEGDDWDYLFILPPCEKPDPLAQSRKEFEAAFDGLTLDRSSINGDYVVSHTHYAWLGWKAARETK